MATPPEFARDLRLRSDRRFPRRPLAEDSGPRRSYQSAAAARARGRAHSVFRTDCRHRTEQPLLQMADAGTDPDVRGDRAQCRPVRSATAPRSRRGLGKIPTAALRALCGRRGLTHSFRSRQRSRGRSRGGRRAGQRRRGDRRGRDWNAASLRRGRRLRLSLRAGRLHPFAARPLGDREFGLASIRPWRSTCSVRPMPRWGRAA